MGLINRFRKIVFRFFPFLDKYRLLRQFIKFCLVGTTNVAVDFSIYFTLTRLFNLHFILANLGSFCVALSWSFYLNKNWTFRSSGGDLKKKYIKFLIINLIGMVINTTVLYCLVRFGGLFDIYSKLIAVVVGTFWNFFCSRFWAFKE